MLGLQYNIIFLSNSSVCVYVPKYLNKLNRYGFPLQVAFPESFTYFLGKDKTNHPKAIALKKINPSLSYLLFLFQLNFKMGGST